MKRLYEVSALVTVYVMAETPDEALSEGADALRAEAVSNGIEPDAVHRVLHRGWPVSGGWNRGSLVYGADDDVTLGEALSELSERP